jgi:hypothetical protein
LTPLGHILLKHGNARARRVKRLVDRFDQDHKVFLSDDYKEEQLRVSRPPARHSAFVVRTFLEPVIHEESIKVAGATKTPDYTFRIGVRRRRTRLGTRTPLTFGLYAVTFRLYCEVNYGHN